MILEPYQIVRELIAGALFLINAYLFWSFVRQVGWSWKAIRKDRAALAALAVATYFFGVAVSRGWDWALAFLTNLNLEHNYPTAEYVLWLVRESWIITVISGGIGIFGGLAMIRIFNPRDRAIWWLMVVGFVSIFTPFAVFLHFHGWPH